ncbi:hypothetical protein MSLAZ_1107 [Methanosarcina lacustris Z-7289]|uniref:Uncharacterized protein n=1 Tax=Methanosarcina lacustris Z-7289 TaxID=1434111 RepID=A0A0E3S5X9_9EURY|nr:hypothetical protein [Methanosarcina lacustris]AKB74368.1 hypothetical protein MSLAZ_1107 [Methanosarcina lacustris Z-7289]
MEVSAEKGIKTLFDYIIENRYHSTDISLKIIRLEEYINENREVATFVKNNLTRIFNIDTEYYLRIMNCVIKKDLYELEILFFETTIINSDCFEKINKDLLCPKLLHNTIKILLKCQLIEHIDFSPGLNQFKIGKEQTRLLSFNLLNNDDRIGLTKLVKDRYINILVNHIDDVDINDTKNHIETINSIYQHLDIQIESYSYSKDNVEKILNCKSVSVSEYDEEIFRIFDILLFPYTSKWDFFNEKFVFLNEGAGVLENGILNILTEDKNIDKKYPIKSVDDGMSSIFSGKEGVVYFELLELIRNVEKNSSIIFKIIFKKFSNEYSLIFRIGAGKIIEKFEKEKRDNMKQTVDNSTKIYGNLTISGNGNTFGSSYQQPFELNKLIEQLKEKGEYKDEVSQLENATESNDDSKIKSTLSKLKDIVTDPKILGAISALILKYKT